MGTPEMVEVRQIFISLGVQNACSGWLELTGLVLWRLLC